MKTTLEDTLLSSIRTIKDYPKPGILFRDITTLLGDARAFRRAIDELVYPYAGLKVDKIAGKGLSCVCLRKEHRKRFTAGP